MQTSLVAALALLAGAEAHLWKTPTMQLVKPNSMVVAQSNYTWTVSNWEAGKSEQSGYYANFLVSAAAWKTAVPAFNATCSIGPEGTPFQDCDVLDQGSEAHVVSARLQATNSTGTDAHLAVSYEFSDPSAADTYWNYTAYAVTPYNELVEGPSTFTLTPTEIWGAA